MAAAFVYIHVVVVAKPGTPFTVAGYYRFCRNKSHVKDPSHLKISHTSGKIIFRLLQKLRYET
jgi:hypothetical protein